ncbi:hypothetical protein ABW19_dt0206245 [Dactylella cylindrospora]|nr:hypothetical protein ABW19_dt0206245 [Dactylella cylindrospora]
MSTSDPTASAAPPADDSNEFNKDFTQTFAPDVKASNQLVKNTPGIVTRAIITEQEISKTYLSARIAQVSYGTYQARPAALMVIDFVFHSADHKNQRFKDAQIEIDFTESGGEGIGGGGIDELGGGATAGTAVEVFQGTSIAQFAPKLVYGEKKVEEITWGLDVSVGANILVGPATVEVANTGVTRETKYSRDHRLVIEGSARGTGPNRLYWSLQERKHDGIPPQFTVAFMVFHPKRAKFSATVKVKASIGFSLDVRRWKVFIPADDKMYFHEDYPRGPEMDPDFDKLDLNSFYRGNLEKILDQGVLKVL